MSGPREQSFMKALFHGVIAEDLMVPYPTFRREERDALSLLLDGIRRLAERQIDPRAIDREGLVPESVLDELRRLGAFGLTVPEEYGGLGLSQSAAARVLQELGAIDGSLSVMLAAHNCMGLHAVLAFGTEEQKRRLLPDLASGRRVAAFALTEAGAGSDGSALETRADLALDGAGYTLTGQKIWITNAAFADVFIVFARTGHEVGHPRITAFVVEKGPGVSVGAESATVGMRGVGVASVTLDGAHVPFRNLLGELGRGYPLGMRVLNWGRLGLSATCIGGAKRVLKLATERAIERRAFGKPIGEFGQTKDKIARMGCEVYALESMVYLTTGLIDAKVEDYILEAAICKVFASETFVRHADEAARLAGGLGYMAGQPFERALRDARGHLVLAGTNEILTAFIALAGMQSPSGKLAEVEKAMRDPIKGLGLLTDFAVKRARTAFGRERLLAIHPVLRAEQVLFEDGVAGLARETERVLRKHGTAIAQKQFVQRCIAEVAIDLFALAAVLSRTTRVIEIRGEDAARREVDFAAGFAQLASSRLTDRLGQMERETDELLKHIAGRTYDEGGYPFDVLR